MPFETVFGPVKVRGSRTRGTLSNSVFLRDNPKLQPIFEWLKRNNIKSVNDIKNVKLVEAFDEIEFQHEVQWRVGEKFWLITFFNAKPLIGDFNAAITEYFKLFKRIFSRPYKKEPEKLKLLDEIQEMERGLEEVKNRLREDL